MRKTTGVIFIILVFILGYLSIGLISFYGMISHYGYEGQCLEIKLPNFVFVEICEVLIICFLISYAILLESFQSFKKNVRFYKILFIPIFINLIFLIYKIIEYPIIIEATGRWSGPGPDDFHMMYNPLIIFLCLYSSIIIWISFKFQKTTQSLKTRSEFFILVVVLSFIVITIACQNTEYIACRG